MTSKSSLRFDQIPVVDMSRWREGGEPAREFAEELCQICHEVGFFVVTDHGVERQMFDQIFELMYELFALPMEVKETIIKDHSRFFRGWERLGSEYTNGLKDIREQVDFWTEWAPMPNDVEPAYLRLLGPNQWFADDVLPGSGALIARWTEALANVAAEIMSILSVGLGFAPDYFEGVFGEQPMSLLKLIHYPPTPLGEAGVNPHHDTGFLTVLAAGDVPGLEVQMADGTWAPVPTVPYGFVINLGELLQAMTGNYFVATSHKVVTRGERFSAAYFHGPSLGTPIRRLPLAPEFVAAVEASPRHRNAGFMAPLNESKAGIGEMESHTLPDTYGEQIWNYFVRSYPQIVSEYYPDAV